MPVFPIDLAWIRSLVNVSLVTLQKKTIRVLTTTDDWIAKIVDSINKKYCNSAKAKLNPLYQTEERVRRDATAKGEDQQLNGASDSRQRGGG